MAGRGLTVLHAIPVNLVGGGLLLINLITVLRFRADKRAAINGTWRVPESSLLGLAVLGGTPGAFLARRLFRHKTRKEPFTTILQVIAVMQVGGIAGWMLI